MSGGSDHPRRNRMGHLECAVASCVIVCVTASTSRGGWQERLAYRFVEGRTLVYRFTARVESVREGIRLRKDGRPHAKERRVEAEVTELAEELRITTEWVAPGGIAARQKATVLYTSLDRWDLEGRRLLTPEESRRELDELNGRTKSLVFVYCIQDDGALVPLTPEGEGKIAREACESLFPPLPAEPVHARSEWVGYLSPVYHPGGIRDTVRVNFGIAKYPDRGDELMEIWWAARREDTKQEPRFSHRPPFLLVDKHMAGRGQFDNRLGIFRRIDIVDAKISRSGADIWVEDRTFVFELREILEADEVRRSPTSSGRAGH